MRLFSCTDLVIHPETLELTNYLTQFSAFQPPHQLKASYSGFLRFKERTVFNSVMTSSNLKMDWYNILYLNYGHNVTFNFDYDLTWFNGYFALHL